MVLWSCNLFKTRTSALRKYPDRSIPVGMLGIGEPLMYAVALPLGKPFVTVRLAPVLARSSTLVPFPRVSGLLFGLRLSSLVTGLLPLQCFLPTLQVSHCSFFGVDEDRITTSSASKTTVFRNVCPSSWVSLGEGFRPAFDGRPSVFSPGDRLAADWPSISSSKPVF